MSAKSVAFLAAIAAATCGSPAVASGKWITWHTPLAWKDVEPTVKQLKADGYKSVFYRGNKIGIRAEHLDLKPTVSVPAGEAAMSTALVMGGWY